MTIRAVIFDLGGVLVRTDDRGPRTRYANRLNLTYEQLDEAVFNNETAARAALGEIPVERHWERVCQSLGIPVAESAAFQEAFWGGDRLDTRLVGYLRSLRPRYKTALLSNAWSDLRRNLEGRWGILDAFDEIFISAEIGLAKPDPRIYHHVVQRLGVAPDEAVFVDDFPENITAARREGLHAVRFTGTDQVIAELERLFTE